MDLHIVLDAPFFARAATEEKMTIAKVEVDRFSITCSKPFEFVVAALKSAVGQPDIVEFFKAMSAAKPFPDLERVVQSTVGRTGLMLFAEFELGAVLRRETGLETSEDHSFLGGQSTHYERNGQARSRCWLLRTDHSPYR